MTDLINQHSKTDQEYKGAAQAFESLGKTAIGESGAAREQLVGQMQDFLKAMSTEERAKFFGSYSDANSDAQKPQMSSMGNGGYSFGNAFSTPHGEVIKDSSGRPTGIEFRDNLVANLYNSVMQNPQNEIIVKP
jgi:hypothetical protein